MANGLDALCQAFLGAGDLEAVEQQLAVLLQQGECAQARLLLDATELRLGTWLQQTSNGAARAQLALCHLLMFLCQDDLDSARFLIRRLAAKHGIAALNSCEELYKRLWSGDMIGATELANQMKKDGVMKDIPLAQKALEHFCARLQARQLQLVQHAYSAVSVDMFGRALGLGTVADVDAFCRWSPGLFEVKDGFVIPKPIKPQETQDVAAHVEKLTKLIVFLESETVTQISGKLPSSTGSTAGNSQQ